MGSFILTLFQHLLDVIIATISQIIILFGPLLLNYYIHDGESGVHYGFIDINFDKTNIQIENEINN